MWALDNRTPFKAERSWARDRDGVHQWLVAVKGTYAIGSDGGLDLADEQVDPLLAPEYHGEPGASSLRYDADLTLPKPTTDVVLNATAHAPGGRPGTNFPVAFRVGATEKTLQVVGLRTWQMTVFGTKPSSPEPVVEIPIRYEYAYGGFDQADPDPKNQRMDPRNPVGCGVAARSDDRIGRRAPSFEYPNGSLEGAGPAGFGAIDSFWSPRRERAGTYDAAWEESRLPLLPVDWDPRALLCAPEDQRPATPLRGGEPVVLLNLTPGGLLQFELPKVYLTFETHFGSRVESHRGRLATVIIEPDYPRVILVWLTALPCTTDVDYLDATVIDEKPFA